MVLLNQFIDRQFFTGAYQLNQLNIKIKIENEFALKSLDYDFSYQKQIFKDIEKIIWKTEQCPCLVIFIFLLFLFIN